MTTAAQFRRYRLAKRYQCIKREGEFVASRFYESYNVHLFQLEGFYSEVWYRIGINQLCFIEIVNNQDTINAYLENINLKKDLGL